MAGRAVLSLRKDKPAAREWLCKPCGTRFAPDPHLAPAEAVRCPGCTAKLGKAADFYAPTDTFARLRARPAPDKPPAPVVPQILVRRSARKKVVWTK